jgi:hypothetical protein
MSRYYYDHSEDQYRISFENYTGPHTKTSHRIPSIQEMDHIKTRQLERIACSLESILEILAEQLYDKQQSQQIES